MGDWGATWNVRYYSDQTENCQAFEDYGYGFLCTDTDRIIAVPTDANGNGVWDGEAGGDAFTQRDAAENHIGATTYHDVSVYWNAPWNAKVTVGVNNMFDKDPPRRVDGVRQLVRSAVRNPGPVLLLPLLAEVLIDLVHAAHRYGPARGRSFLWRAACYTD